MRFKTGEVILVHREYTYIGQIYKVGKYMTEVKIIKRLGSGGFTEENTYKVENICLKKLPDELAMEHL